jgi:hypothetical protein
MGGQTFLPAAGFPAGMVICRQWITPGGSPAAGKNARPTWLLERGVFEILRAIFETGELAQEP